MDVVRPLQSEHWYRVAGLRLRLHRAAQSHRQIFRGRTWYVIREPLNDRYVRLHEVAYRFLALLDGMRTVDEAWAVSRRLLGDAAPSQVEVLELLAWLYESNLLQGDVPPDVTEMLTRQRTRRRREAMGRLANVLVVRLPLVDPDRWLERALPLFGWLFTGRGLALWSVVMLLGLAALVGRVSDLMAAVSRLFDPDPLSVLLLYLTFVAVKLAHECGHGLACKKLSRAAGGDGAVHTLGIMLLAIVPAPYIDATSAWALKSKWRRAVIGAAGMYVELALAALAALVWAHTAPGLVHAIAANVVVVASVTTLLFNGNPLLRFDGYYIASDLLEIPNLYQRSREYCLYLVKRYAFGIARVIDPSHTVGERGWLVGYAVASSAYWAFVCFWLFLFLADRFFVLGVLLAAMGVLVWCVVPLVRAFGYALWSPEVAGARPRTLAVSLAVTALACGGLVLVPVSDQGRAEGIVEPRHMAYVFMAEEGVIERALPSGTPVSPAGPPLISARNQELVALREEAQADIGLTRVRLQAAEIDDPAEARALRERLHALGARVHRVNERIAALEVKAPLAGVWIAPQIDRLRGTRVGVDRERPLGMVAKLDDFIIRVVADQTLGPRIASELGAGARAEVRLRGRADVFFLGEIERIAPGGQGFLPAPSLSMSAGGSLATKPSDPRHLKSDEPFFEIQIRPLPMDPASPALLAGQRVLVRFDLGSRSLAAQGWRALRQLVQRRFGA